MQNFQIILDLKIIQLYNVRYPKNNREEMIVKKQGLLKRMLVLLLCAALVLPFVPIDASAAALDNFDTGSDFSGVKMSVIGDSISTYYGITNSSTYNPLYLSTSEATFGTYYGNTSHGDYAEFSSVKWTDTWWKQTVDTLGMDLLVNNAWSGSFTLVDTGQSNTTEYPAAGYKNRAVNLHKGTTKPDIICVYLGTNDIAYYASQNVGTKADIDTASERNALYTSVNNYKTPTSAIQAYYIMISRMMATYPDAEIYCLLPTICMNAMGSGRKTALNDFNAGVSYIVDYFAGNGKNIFLVDLPTHSGLVDETVVRNYYYCNNVHPSVEGMDFITNCVVSEILEHSQKGKQTSKTANVSYSFDRTFSATGLPRKTIVGKPFELKILPYTNGQDVKLTVTMKDANGNAVTIPGGGVSGESVYIPSVTGDITIQAEVFNKPDSFYWEAVADDFAAIPGNGYTYNQTTLLSGTYSKSGSTATMSSVQYSLAKPVILQYDQPWVLEWQSGGNTYAGGIMLFNKETDSSTSGNMYIHITQSDVFFGYRDSVGYNNSGVAWTTIASKLGSSSGSDIRKEMLDFKIVNVPNGTNNKLWLYVNGVQIGTMDSSKKIGGSATDSNVSNINLSGKDFEFNYLGSSSHTWNNCNISYIRVHETGTLNTVTSFDNYRWEPSGGKLVSVVTDGFAKNAATQVTGSISGTAFTSATFELDQDVVLSHDKSWTIEWASSGSWSGDRNGSFLMATVLPYKANSAHYIFRQGGSSLIGIGEWTNGIHNNYGLSLADYGIDGSAYHKYTLKNEPIFKNGEWTSNMVYLYVDDVKLGAMNQYFPSGEADGTTSDWLNGRDLVFGAIGNSSFTLGGCNLDYLQVTTGCSHTYGSWSTTTAATCTTTGVQTRTCSQCGEKETKTLAAIGHSYTSVTYTTTCQTFAHTCYTCSRCGDTYNTYPAESMSDWQTAKPNVDASMMETATQYRYSDYETTTSYETALEGYERVNSEWVKYDTGTVNYVNSWPSGFDTSNSLYNTYNNKAQKVTASSTDTTKLEVNSDAVVGYLYYHWCYDGYPYTSATKTGNYNRFHAYYSTETPSSADASDSSDDSYRFDDSTACDDSVWYFAVPVYAQTYTTYKNLFTYGRWGTPSEWTMTAMEGSDTRQVETRTVYRYVTGELGKHSYVNNICTVCGQAKPNVDYYLFGYINGANYGCEEDDTNMGSYKFVDGQLTVQFSQDSYVGVKTTNNGDWYMTDGWQGNETTVVTLYNTASDITADKFFVPGGVELIFTLRDNGNDTLTLSYEIKECQHVYNGIITKQPDCLNAGVKTYLCVECGDSYTESISATGHSMNAVITKPTCTDAGYTTYTCSSCGYSYVGDRIGALGHGYSTTVVPNTCTQAGYTLYECVSCGHSYTADRTDALGHSYTTKVTAPTCTEQGYTTYTCTTCGESYNGNIIAATGHSYVNGTCGICGAADSTYVPTYYLVGYINGADYGCEGDYANMGNYKFVNGKLVATFTQDSYVFLKTEGNGAWYMTQSYCADTSATFYNTNSGSSEKMLVPGGVEITFTLTDNGNDTLTLSYVAADPEVVVPTLALKAPALEFKDMIKVIAFYTVDDMTSVVELGMITYTEMVDVIDINTAAYVIPGADYEESSGRYFSGSQGIHAKFLGDTVYLACYAKLTDGSYVYTKLAPYSPITYATNQLKNSTNTQLKQLVAAMLNYGAAAQNYFLYNTDTLANATLTDEQKALPEAYRADMVSAVPAASASKQGIFANNQGFSLRKPAVSFEGAFSINYFFTPKYAPVDGITLYYWNEADYNAASVLTTANATGAIKMVGSGLEQYRGDIEGIAAKDLSKAIYVAAVYSDGTTTWTSGVLGYSIGAYCSSLATKGGTMADLAMATAVYGYHAKQYFG